jgi:nicotinamide-nucleotide amidase
VLPINASAEVITFGRELLIGNTLNTNGSWLARQLTSSGIIVRRISTVGDSVAEISQAFEESFERSPSIVITTGGLGSTYDDLTFEGLASALHLPKEVNESALKGLQERYASLNLGMTPERRKMALMPAGASALGNEAGAAPGLRIKQKDTLVFCLPGVPKEMMEMFGQVLAIIKTTFPLQAFRERSFLVEGIRESSLAPYMQEWVKANPLVYLKSHPGGTEPSPQLTIHLSSMGKEELIDDLLSSAEESFANIVAKAGGKVRRQES